MELFGERITTCETIDQLCDPEDSIEVSRAQRRAGRPGNFRPVFFRPGEKFYFQPGTRPGKPRPFVELWRYQLNRA